MVSNWHGWVNSESCAVLLNKTLPTPEVAGGLDIRVSCVALLVWVSPAASRSKGCNFFLTSSRVNFDRLGKGTALQPLSVLCLQELHWGCVRP